ncbi:uncharacterized protein APUU_41162S [Aspergillus puulaauensis]|uniref:Uncharacterized protein n=1 Tax=Aspergillus puulaauensis TaxID=1220207 RepID=A0A7R7XPR0_9EURO|nr:uncharacterized protein APUU_41162S [Aspergillus puulaauensis]BCS24718.1 hypothetical protein APUU_41162S [Aspergillus puulaauensis]
MNTRVMFSCSWWMVSLRGDPTQQTDKVAINQFQDAAEINAILMSILIISNISRASSRWVSVKPWGAIRCCEAIRSQSSPSSQICLANEDPKALPKSPARISAHPTNHRSSCLLAV